MTFSFTVTHKDQKTSARLGKLATPHGVIDTPNFIFCGTKAAIKGLSPAQMREAGTDIILSNTYHLMLSPGADLVAEMGGLHRFMGWDGPMFTDSGGFQIFSLNYGSITEEIKRKGQTQRRKTMLRITEEGAEFQSYIDGKIFFLTPEESVDIQRKLGADLIVQLDECTPFHTDRDYTARQMRMSTRWGDRSLAEWQRKDDGKQKMYGIVSGGVYEDLRRESAEWTKSKDFFATAIGDSLGGSKEQMYDVVATTMKHVHPSRPVHLLGIGTFADIWTHVRAGIDTFDCVQPTRLARHGSAIVKGAPKERLNLSNAAFKQDKSPIDESCGCHTCKNHSRSYIHHLFRVGELLGMQLVSIHNVFTMNRLMRDVRKAIAAGTVDETEKEWVV